ncbi:MAG: hypothetical protein JNK72_21265 [Myxococcales bacterium]|nr:hypothetical protein [Myxococcales bacterium]
MIASAPGKLMLTGEYAVLHGGRALVMAVDRRVQVRARHPSEGAATRFPPEAVAAWALARARGLLSEVPDPTRLFYDLGAVSEAGRKLGVGSSAALCAAALAWALVDAGHTARPDFETRRGWAQLARAGHREAQGGGSGVDVIASTLGGVVSCTLGPDLDDPVSVSAVAWPRGLYWKVLWSGEPALTREMLQRVRAFEARDRAGFVTRIGAIAAASEAAHEAFLRDDASESTRAFAAHGEAMRALGVDAEVPIVTEALASLTDACRPLGVAIKPSGAGGGDVSLAVSYDPEALARVDTLGAARGFQTITMHTDHDGVAVSGG